MPDVRLLVHGCYYTQTRALFWSDDYTGGEPHDGSGLQISPEETVSLAFASKRELSSNVRAFVDFMKSASARRSTTSKREA
jgi:hypothetical protein